MIVVIIDWANWVASVGTIILVVGHRVQTCELAAKVIIACDSYVDESFSLVN